MLYSFRIIVTILITIIIANVFSIYNISNKYLYKYIIINYVVVSLFGIIQLITYPSAMDFYNIFYKIGVYFPNPDPHNGRLISTYFDPNFLAACLIIPLTLILNQYIKNGNLKNLIGIVFFISIIILTVSRSGVLGICLILIINFILSIKFNDRKIDLKDAKMIRAFIIMITIGSFFIILTMFSNIPVFKRILNTKEDDSTYARVNSWSKGIEIINNGYGSENDSKIEKKEEKNDGIIDSSKDKNGKNHSRGNIFIGTGYNMLGFMESNQDKPKSISFGNDSSIMVILISSGIIGMIYFIYIIISTIYKLWKEKEESIFNEVIIEIIISSLIICNFNNLLFYTLWIFPVFLLLNINEINYIEK
ncbi:MAG: O-antigen ligase family protein [Clostridia bacterium]|nr:O-antigen ligase family protein [Clostridia bacterium]